MALFCLPWLVLLIFALGLAFGVSGSDVPLLGVTALIPAVALVPLALDLGRPPERRHYMLAMVCIVYTVFFVIPVFTWYIPAIGPVDPSGMVLSNLLPPDITYSQLLALAGLVCFMIGYALPIGRVASRVMPVPRWEWTRNATLMAAFGLILLGWMIALGRRFDMIPEQIGSGLIGGFQKATFYGPAILAVAYLRHGSRFALLAIVVLVPITSLFNFFSGRKQFVLMPLAMIVLSWIVMIRKIRFRWIVLGILSVIVLYPTAQFYRKMVLQMDLSGASDVLRNPGPAMAAMAEFVSNAEFGDYLAQGLEATGRRLDGVGHLAVIVRDTPRLSPFQNGRTLALIPIAYVPRVLWPGKPGINLGAWIVDTYRYKGENIDSAIAPTWVGEFYLNFAVPGVLVGMTVLGMLLRFARESLTARVTTTFIIVIETVVLFEVMLQPAGGVANVINAPIFAMFPIFLAHYLIRLLGGARRVDASGTGFQTPGAAVAST